jgi:hypothetical protein
MKPKSDNINEQHREEHEILDLIIKYKPLLRKLE